MVPTIIVNALNTFNVSRISNLNPIILKAVHGSNQTDTLLKLLDSSLQFHNLSKGGRYWGKLATWITKYNSIKYQVDHGIASAVIIEDDVIPSHNWNIIQPVQSSSLIFKYSTYAEVFAMSFEAANKTLSRLQSEGIRKNDDQQLFQQNTRQMYARDCFKLTRKTNKGIIINTPRMTWIEMAMLRKITMSPSFHNNHLGNPKNYAGKSCWSKSTTC